MNNEDTLQLIYQYLEDRQFSQALTALQDESGIKYDYAVLAGKPNRLRVILNEHLELSNALLGTDPTLQTEMSGEQSLRVHGCDKAASVIRRELEKAHTSGIITLRSVETSDGRSILITSAASKEVKIWDVTNIIKGSAASDPVSVGVLMSQSPCLSLELHPTIEGLLLMGYMDGSVKIVSNVYTDERKTVFEAKDLHQKYVVRVKWGQDCFATASYDKTVCLFNLEQPGGEREGKYKFEKKWSFCGNVESIEFTADRSTLIVAVRGDNYLNYINLASYEINRVNMNANGDDHVSFTPMHIQCSPSGEHLLVQTDKDRIIVMRTHTPIQSRNLYGTVNNEFSQPRACWHPSGKYIYGTSQNNIIYAWDVMTEQVVYRLKGHTGYPRDLVFHPNGNLLTCSYDRSVRIWENDN